MSRPHVLAFTSLFRTPNERVRAPFTSEFLRALQAHARVTLVSPIPWAPDLQRMRQRPEWARYIGVPPHATVDGIDVHYVRYLMLPRISGPLQAGLQALASLAVCRRIHAEHPVTVINGRFIYPDGVAATLLARQLGVPAILTALGTDMDVYSHQRFKQGQIAWALRRAARLTAVSPSLAQRMVDMGADPARVSSAVNGIDLDRFVPTGPSVLRQRCGLAPERRVLVSLARLSSEKGLNVLLDALHLLHREGRCDFHTVLIGDGPERAALLAQTARLGLGGVVHFAGEVDHAEVPAWLRGASAFCLASFREGTPNVVIEALASGVPVVATSVGGTPALIRPDNGRLVPPRDARALADAINQVMQGNWQQDQIRQSVAHMSWRSEAERHMALVQAVVQERAGAGGAT